MFVLRTERHRGGLVAGLRAAAMGANGSRSTASLLRGVAAAHPTHNNAVLAADGSPPVAQLAALAPRMHTSIAKEQ